MQVTAKKTDGGLLFELALLDKYIYVTSYHVTQ